MSEHSNSMLRVRAAQLHARLEEAAQAHQRLVAENTDLRERLEEALDMLVNVYDLCSLDEEWAGNVAMVLAKNDIDTTPVTLGEVTL